MIRSRLAVLVTLLALDPAAHARQLVEARDGETVIAKISRREVTRLTVEQGRIQRITGTSGELIVEKDDERGQVFLRPVDPATTKPFNLFVSSTQGTIALLLQPVDIPSETIVIREVPPAPRLATAHPRATRHVRQLKNLLLAMATDALTGPFEVRDGPRDRWLRPGVPMRLERSWRDSDLVGEKYTITAPGTEPLALSGGEFFKPGVLGVSIEGSPVSAGGTATVFILRERRGDD